MHVLLQAQRERWQFQQEEKRRRAAEVAKRGLNEQFMTLATYWLGNARKNMPQGAATSSPKCVLPCRTNLYLRALRAHNLSLSLPPPLPPSLAPRVCVLSRARVCVCLKVQCEAAMAGLKCVCKGEKRYGAEFRI